jgi:hypothetical protein
LRYEEKPEEFEDMFLSFPHLWHITGSVTRITWRAPLVEQKLDSLQIFSFMLVRYSSAVRRLFFRLTQMELMLTVPVGDCIVFQTNYIVTLIYCKSVTTNRLCCICNIYYCACMNNEDTTVVFKP